MSDYFAEQIVEPGKLALFLMLVAFIVTSSSSGSASG